MILYTHVYSVYVCLSVTLNFYFTVSSSLCEYTHTETCVYVCVCVLLLYIHITMKNTHSHTSCFCHLMIIPRNEALFPLLEFSISYTHTHTHTHTSFKCQLFTIHSESAGVTTS